MSYLIQTAPGAAQIKIEVTERVRGPVVQGRQMPEVLSFTCEEALQFPAFPQRARIRDAVGRFYDFIPTGLQDGIHSGYIEALEKTA